MVYYDMASNSYFIMANFPTDFGIVRDKVYITPSREEIEFLFSRKEIESIVFEKESANGKIGRDR